MQRRSRGRALPTLVLVLVAASLLTAAPAAASSPVVTWRNPAEGDAYLRVPGPLSATARDPDGNGIFDAALTLDAPALPDDPCRPAAEAVTVQSFPGAEGGGDVAVAFPVRFPCNRRYTAVLSVRSQTPLAEGPDEAEVRRLELLVALPPATVGGLDAGFDPASETVPAHTDLTWVPNAEPDLLGYRIERTDPDADSFEAVVDLDASATTYRDSAAYQGLGFRYRVRAVRQGPDAAVPFVLSAAGTEVGPDLRSEEARSADAAEVSADEEPATADGRPGSVAVEEPASGGPAPEEAAPGAPDAAAFDPGGAATATAPGGPLAPATPSRPPVTVDDGFDEELPFGVPPTSVFVPGTPAEPAATPAPTAPAPPLGPEVPAPADQVALDVAGEEAAGEQVAIDDVEEGGGPSPVVPVTAGVVLLFVAGGLFWLTRRAATPAPAGAPPA